jgi:hypothetical protein
LHGEPLRNGGDVAGESTGILVGAKAAFGFQLFEPMFQCILGGVAQRGQQVGDLMLTRRGRRCRLGW